LRHQWNDSLMTMIRVKENEPFDVALRRFKRTIEKLGLLTELRAREFYEKPTAERKRKKAATTSACAACSCRKSSTKSRGSGPTGRRCPPTYPGPPEETQAGFLVSAIERDTMSLKERITEDMKAAMRAKDAERLGTIRLLTAAMKQKEVDERIELDDTAVIGILDKMLKQRKDSIEAFEKAGRQDLADKEKAETAVLQAYLPARLSADEITAQVKAIVAELGAKGPGDMGKVMGAVKAKLAGKADMGLVSAAVKAALAP
jgi:uncharacterized protein